MLILTGKILVITNPEPHCSSCLLPWLNPKTLTALRPFCGAINPDKNSFPFCFAHVLYICTYNSRTVVGEERLASSMQHVHVHEAGMLGFALSCYCRLWCINLFHLLYVPLTVVKWTAWTVLWLCWCPINKDYKQKCIQSLCCKYLYSFCWTAPLSGVVVRLIHYKSVVWSCRF